MASTAERNGEFIANFAAKRAALAEAEMMERHTACGRRSDNAAWSHGGCARGRGSRPNSEEARTLLSIAFGRRRFDRIMMSPEKNGRSIAWRRQHTLLGEKFARFVWKAPSPPERRQRAADSSQTDSGDP